MKHRPALAVLAALTLLLCAIPCSAKTVYVKWDSPGPTRNGTSWDSAYRNIEAGLNVSVSGDQIRVARGTYAEMVTLKAGVGLYGGYAGSGTTRDIATYVTTIRGNTSDFATVIAPSGVTATARIDGFTIRDGANAICCEGGSPTIANNTIAWNVTRGMIVYSPSNPTVIGNVFRGNSSEGIYVHGGAATIVNNAFLGNGQFGLRGASLIVINNTAVGNGGMGINTGTGSITFNNIIAYNHLPPLISGSFGNNWIYRNGNAVDSTPDPKIAGWEYGGYHLRPDSPCRNAGTNTAPGLPSTDIDGQARVQDGTVDIGCDESNGASWSSEPGAIVRVSPTGNDANDGSSWSLAKQTVQAGISAVKVLGGEVWVKAGTYAQCLTIEPFAHLYGGFAGTETSRSQRNWTDNRSILDGGNAGVVVSFPRFGLNIAAIDGFTIRNGNGVYPNYGIGGIDCNSSSPAIRNNLITANNGYGINCTNSYPVIANNTIAGNASSGIAVLTASPTITNNTIVGNGGSVANYGGCGICIVCDSSPVITNNITAFNVIGIWGGCHASDPWSPPPPPPTPILRNNCVYGNTSGNFSTVSPGAGDISVDPLFVDRAGGDYHLTASSRCKNVGWNDALGLPTIDFEGEARIYGGTVDIGADEYWSTADTLSAAKSVADGTQMSLKGFTVSAAFDGFFYIQAGDRSSGIRVDKSAHGTSAGRKVNISGTLFTNADGERYIAAMSITPSGTDLVEAILLSNRSVGGGDWLSGGAGQYGVTGGVDLNNIGLLVATTGKVTCVGSGFFYLDDGSRLYDGSGYIGVKVTTEGQTMPALNSYVKVTGASSCYKQGSDLFRLIRATGITTVIQ